MANEEITNPSTPEQTGNEFVDNITKMTSYMRFIGTYTMVMGVITCLGIVTAIIGIPTIYMGLRMKEAAESFSLYSENKNFQYLADAIEKQKKFLYIQYVLTIIGLIILGIYVVVLIGILASS